MTDLSEGLKVYRDEPVKFVRQVLKAEPETWQEEALNALAQTPRVAIRSGHGVGKTALQSWAVCWFLLTRPFPKIPCTAPTKQQLSDVLWTEISKWLKRSPLMSELFEWQKTKVCFKAMPERWFATARTANKPENMAGFHEEHLLFVLDEASGISDEIFEAIEGALTSRDAKLLICGNPTRNSGFFKRAFFEDRELYHTLKVASTQVKRVSPTYSQRLIKQYGEDSDVVRVRVLGEFPAAESSGLIALEDIEAAMLREPDFRGELVIGVDVARFGDDETVIFPRIGYTATKFERYRKTDLMTTAGRVIHVACELMNRHNLKSARINIDDDGVGGGVTDRLNEVIRERRLPLQVRACHNGGKARDPHYANFVTECYFALRERLQSGEIVLPSDDELCAQLSTRKYQLNSRDQLVLEDKPTYKRRVKRSPDRADALALAFAPVGCQKFSPPPIMAAQNSYWR